MNYEPLLDPEPADRATVRAAATRMLAAYGIDPAHVLGVALELRPYGTQELVVRLMVTPAALDALERPT